VEEVYNVFRKACAERNSRLHTVDFSKLRFESFDVDGQVFDYEGYNSLKISLLGGHQVRNAAVAVKTAEVLREKGLSITEDSIRRGLVKARWPGRLEIVSKGPLFLIDGAHNIEGAKALSEALRLYFPNKRVIFIFGVLKDKDYRSMIEAVAPMAEAFITVTPKSGRALPAKDLAKIIGDYCKNVSVSDTIKEAIETSFKLASSDGLICAFGSLYYIGEARKHFKC